MKYWSIVITFCLVIGDLLFHDLAHAHGTAKHMKNTAADAQMEKMHAMMPMFSIVSAQLEKALEKGEMAAIETETRKIIAAIPDLEKSKPHKNIRQRKQFTELAAKLGETVSDTADQAKKGDLAGAMVSFRKAEDICAACHAKFKD